MYIYLCSLFNSFHLTLICFSHSNFELNSTKCKYVVIGLIKTKSRIDYESVKNVQFNVTVTDTGIPQLTSTAEIIVDVINTNDNDPIFNNVTGYTFNVMENSPKGTVIGRVQANDNDNGNCRKTF